MRSLLYSALAILCAGCVTPGEYLSGQIYSIEQGKVLEFEIEVSYGNGKVRAKDPKSGELFQGTYVAISDGDVSTGVANTTVGRRNIPTIVTASSSSILATSSALLVGDKGTMLECAMTIEKSHTRPKGIGSCVDQIKNNYRLQF